MMDINRKDTRNMKRFKYLFSAVLAFPLVFSCGVDNYDMPEETFRGAFIDKETKAPFQTATGGTGIRIRMMEYSWSDDPTPYDFYAKADGTFQNTKVFKGSYGVTPEGAFVPLGEEIIDIKGVVEKTYEVEPLLRVEWIGEPVVDTEAGTVTVKVKITRGTDNPDWQQPLAEAWLFVAESSHVADNNYSPNLSTHLTAQELEFGKEITIVSGYPKGMTDEDPIKFPYSREYGIRVAARTNVQITGQNKYNYTTVKIIKS